MLQECEMDHRRVDDDDDRSSTVYMHSLDDDDFETLSFVLVVLSSLFNRPCSHIYILVNQVCSSHRERPQRGIRG